MTTSISNAAHKKNMKLTNIQSKVLSRCLVVIRKKKIENVQKLNEKHKTIKNQVFMYFEA